MFGGFSSSVDKIERVIIVSGIPPSADEKVVYQHFSRCGVVLDVQLFRNRHEMLTGLAAVEFLEDESVTRACSLPVAMNVVLGAALQTRRADAQQKQAALLGFGGKRPATRQSFAHQVLSGLRQTGEVGPHMRKLHIKNLRPVVTEEDMRGIFKPFGDFEAFVMGSQECWITFQVHTDAQDAMSSMQAFQLVGQELQIILQSVGVPVVLTPIGEKPFAENMDLKLDSDFGATGTGSTAIHNRLEIMQKLMAARPLGSSQAQVLLGFGGERPPMGAALAASSAAPPVPKPGSSTSRTLLLQNMYTPGSVDLKRDPKFYEDIREDTREECSKFGKVLQVTVDPRGAVGLIYVLFESPHHRLAGELALNGRWFEGKKILASNIDDTIWQALAAQTQAAQAAQASS